MPIWTDRCRLLPSRSMAAPASAASRAVCSCRWAPLTARRANASSRVVMGVEAPGDSAKEGQASMVGVNIGAAAPMAYFACGGAKDRFFGDLKAHGRDAFEFYPDKKVTISRWF